jgi:hypothetical protein
MASPPPVGARVSRRQVTPRRALGREPSVDLRGTIEACSPIHADGPTLVREPFHHDVWVYEEKVDG